MNNLFKDLDRIRILENRIKELTVLSAVRYDTVKVKSGVHDSASDVVLRLITLQSELAELRQRVQYRMSALNEIEKKVVMMRYDGLSVRTISEKLFYSVDYIYKICNRCKIMLKEKSIEMDDRGV